MDNQSLDNLFKNKLDGFEKKPRPEAWQKLEFLLDENLILIQKKKKRRKIIWLSVAASLTLLFLSRIVLLNFLENKAEIHAGYSIIKDSTTYEKSPSLSHSDSIRPEKSGKTGYSSKENQASFAENQTIKKQKQSDQASEKDIRNKQNNTEFAQKESKNKTNIPKDKKPERKLENPENNSEIQENSLVQNTGTQETRKGYKIVVKVSLKSGNTADDKKTDDEALAKQNDNQPKRNGKFFRKLKGKQSDDKDHYAILGIDPEKIWASMGK